MTSPRFLHFMLLVSLGLFVTTRADCQTVDTNNEKKVQEPDKKTSPDADQLAKEKRQLNSIGGLHFFLTRADDLSERIMAFDGSNSAHTVYLQLDKPSQDLVANYRFEGEANFHPLAKNGVSENVEIPAHVNMIVVNMTWCNSTCAMQLHTEPAGYLCPMEKEAEAADESSAQPQNPTGPSARCELNVIFVRDLIGSSGDLLPAFIISANGLEISETLLEQIKSPENPSYVLNGTPLSEYYLQERTLSGVNDLNVQSFVARDSAFGWSSVKSFHIERYPSVAACHPYSIDDSESIDVDRPPTKIANLLIDNGISVAPSKVFDTYTLRQMLATTSSQLAGISGFNQANIASAYGTLQGITRDTSYFSAQVTTVPTPTISSVAANGATGSDTLANTLTLTNGTTGTSTVITCPPGTLPAVGTSGVPACAAVSATPNGPSTGAGNTSGGLSSVLGSQLNLGSTQNSSNTGVQTNNQQNTTTTTSGGQGGTVAPIPVSTPLSAPTNVGISASDMLAEQVQLNSQITTLRLLLQGALSDQYLVRNSFAVATRQQTTVGFAISLDPPQRFRHAVAEVRVWIDSPLNDNRISVMNLLPADKTYNVAKITSHQNAFGAGAVIEAVNVGANTGKSKDRLYLAKDTDTVALQFTRDKPAWKDGADRLPRSTQEHIRDAVREATIWQNLDDACGDPADANSVVFGWQFRPVLGADYVQAGQRLVFAQLALPTGLGAQFAPLVHVQTRWREYDSKHQVVGAVYKGSCSVSEDPNPITVLSPLRVLETKVADMGSGILKIGANGTFFSSGFVALTGQNTISPTIFDGRSIQLFGNATNFLTADDLELVGEDGRKANLGMQSRLGPVACGLSVASLTATPRSDGNSFVDLEFTSGSGFSLQLDKAPHPLVLIGSQVFGLHETPFLSAGDACTPIAAGGINCKYRFVAPTDALRAAQTFTVRDLAWKDFKKSGSIEFDPILTTLTSSGAKATSENAVCPATGAVKIPDCAPPALYSVSGYQLDKIRYDSAKNSGNGNWNCQSAGCLEAFQGMDRFTLTDDNFRVLSKTSAILQISGQSAPAITYAYKGLTFLWHSPSGEDVEWALSFPKETKTPITASSILNVGDSTQLVFNDVDVMGAPATSLGLVFDNVAIPGTAFKYDAEKKTVTVAVTTAMTTKPGHKEMTLAYTPPPAPGKPAKQEHLQLPFEVTKR
jgi:hypothetical protein